jgi:hypothetical protein
MNLSARSLAMFAGVLALAGGRPATADEGMWLVNNPPLAQLKSTHGFEPSAEWMTAMQQAAVRVGASGSFVSAEGLVMTNHHVASDAIAKLSTAERDLLKNGFLAGAREQELRCEGQEITVLMSISDVSEQVKAAVKPGMSGAEAVAARRAVIGAMEKAESQSTGLLCRVVTLYNGGQYHLYRSKRFTDVRLVFAPELQAAFFGGDADNFEYPRFCLDVAFFRVYEDGKPYRPAHHLRWSAQGSKEGDLAIVFGHPGRTQRLLTVDHLRFVRDVELPARLAGLWRSEIKLQSYAGRSAENARIAGDPLFGVANGRKAITGQHAGLLDPAVFARKVADERALRQAVAANPEWAKQWGDAWEKLAEVNAQRAALATRSAVLGRVGSDALATALTIVRLGDEAGKPSAERLAEFRDANLANLKQSLSDDVPFVDSMEVADLESYLLLMAERLGGEHPVLLAMLGGKSPRAAAEAAIAGTALKTAAGRKALVEGPASGIISSNDPLLVMARAMDAAARAYRSEQEQTVEAVERAQYARIAEARFAVRGDTVYPDATGTLRMSYGPIRGYNEGGQAVPAYTTMGGIFTRAEERREDKAFAIPASWAAAKDRLNLSTPFNFVCTADIIGGNSGSPVVNRQGEVIGLIFDGNIHSLPGAFAYDDVQARAVAVDSRAIIEALRVVYKADGLVKELLAR